MRLFLLVLLIALRCSVVSAQEAASPEALRAAKDLTAILSPDMVGQMMRAMTAQVWPRLEAQFKSKVDDATLAELKSEFENGLQKYSPDFANDLPPLYARYFSAQELREMTAFYRTSTGAKALQLMPQITAEYMGSQMPRLQAVSKEMQANIIAVLRRHGYEK